MEYVFGKKLKQSSQYYFQGKEVLFRMQHLDGTVFQLYSYETRCCFSCSHNCPLDSRL